MVFQRCSDLVESSGGAAIRDAESRRNAAFSSVRNSPGTLVFEDARTSDDHSPRRTGPLNRRVKRLVKRSRHRASVAPIDNENPAHRLILNRESTNLSNLQL